MRLILILCLIFLPVYAVASENLMENIEASNAVITDGVVSQITADPRSYLQWKFQIFCKDAFEQPFVFEYDKTGFLSYTFTMPDFIPENVEKFAFGINGLKIDTKVYFDIKDVQPNTTYTIQWRVLNTTQGEVSWTDMLLVHCPDGYKLALGDTACSRICENQSVPGGHISPDIAQVYEPDVCTYKPSNLVCDDGYANLDNACEQLCPAGITRLHYGQKFGRLYARKTTAPSLCVQYNGSTCYGRLTTGKSIGLNIELNGTIYHLID